MSISTIHKNHGCFVVQPQVGADAARVSNDAGEYIDVSYDAESKSWVIEPSFAAGVALDQRTILLRKL